MMIGTTVIDNTPYHCEEDENGKELYLILDQDGNPIKKGECICFAYGPSECVCGAWDEPIGED